MAGQGRRASKLTGELLTWDGIVRGPELPATRPDLKEWLPESKAYYESFRRSPQALKMGSALDWSSVQDLVFLKDCFYRRPGAQMAAEIRARENSFGITPLARHALKWEAPGVDAEAAGGGASVNVVDASRMDDVRAEILG